MLPPLCTHWRSMKYTSSRFAPRTGGEPLLLARRRQRLRPFFLRGHGFAFDVSRSCRARTDTGSLVTFPAMASGVFITTFAAMLTRLAVSMARHWPMLHLVLRASATTNPTALPEPAIEVPVALGKPMHTARGGREHRWHQMGLDTKGNRIQENALFLYDRRSIGQSHSSVTTPSPVLRAQVRNRMSSPL